MATLAITYDTVTKRASFVMDGTPITDVDCFSLSQRWVPDSLIPEGGAGIYWMELCSRVMDEVNKTSITHRITAAKDGNLVLDEVKPAAKAVAAQVDEDADAKVKAAIIARYTTKRK